MEDTTAHGVISTLYHGANAGQISAMAVELRYNHMDKRIPMRCLEDAERAYLEYKKIDLWAERYEVRKITRMLATKEAELFMKAFEMGWASAADEYRSSL